MKDIKRLCGENNMFILLILILITGLIFNYRLGVSRNDFWWHVKAGEWIVNNREIPRHIDIFSWFAKETGVKWIPQEWLSEVFLYIIHNYIGNLGIFILSLFSAIGMIIITLFKNKKEIKKNVILSLIYLFPIIFLFPTFFYGRPQMISYFLLYVTLLCLYKYKEDESSKSIYLVPVISILWSNFHGGSATLSYILCIIFIISGISEFSVGKLQGQKLSKKQLQVYSMCK